MRLKLGQFYKTGRKSGDGNFNANDILLVYRDLQQQKMPGDRNNVQAYEALNVETGRSVIVSEVDLDFKFNTECIEVIKDYFEKEIQKLEKRREAINDIGKEDITQEEFALWAIAKISEKPGTTNKQKAEALKSYFDAI